MAIKLTNNNVQQTAVQVNTNNNNNVLRVVKPQPKVLRVVIQDSEGDTWGGIIQQTNEEGIWTLVEV